MSLGIFRSIRGSYAEPYRKEAEKIIRARYSLEDKTPVVIA